jgi:hypothetical protein
MNNTQQQEAIDYEAGYDRFEGYDRGDRDRDYTADQNAMNEADDMEHL